MSTSCQTVYFVYMVECRDGSFYTGISVNPTRRIEEHNTNARKAAKYTWAHRPVKLVYIQQFSSKSAALKREFAIKKLSRKEKISLIV